MTIKDWLDRNIKVLETMGVPTARLDAEVLIANELGKDRSWLQAHGDYVLDDQVKQKLDDKLERRANHEPIAYIQGKQEFHGCEFFVDKSVLVPRPESEMMIELLLNQVESQRSNVEELQIVDIGTGSGNLIITSALEMSKVEGLRSKVKYIGLDISEDALEVARTNTKNLKANIEFKHFDLLNDSLSKISNSKYQIFLANLPYVPDDYPVNEATKHEPNIALFSGEDGLDHYRRLFVQLNQLIAKGEKLQNLIVITESLIEQHEQLKLIAENAGFKQTTEKDLVQVFETVRSTK